jgi:hypothetical protein
MKSVVSKRPVAWAFGPIFLILFRSTFPLGPFLASCSTNGKANRFREEFDYHDSSSRHDLPFGKFDATATIVTGTDNVDVLCRFTDKFFL